jgi:hypothetical protein
MTWSAPIREPAVDRGPPFWAHLIAAFSIVLLAGLFALQQLVDFDVLWHVRTGQWILATHQVPRTDPFGGRTTGLPWLDVAWGFQVIAAALAGRVGLAGLQIAMTLVVIATLCVSFRRAPRTPLVLAGSLLFVLATGFRFLVRPDLLTLPLAMIAIALIERLALRPASSIVLIGLLTAVWSNLHGSYVLAPILLLAATLGAWPGATPPRSVRDHATALLVSVAAPLANPCGIRIYALLTPYVRSVLAALGLMPGEASLTVSEWTPTWRALVRDAIFPTSAFLLFIAILGLSFLLAGRKAPLGRLLATGAMLALALSAVRNVLPFGAVALAVLSRNERDRLALEADERTGDLKAAGGSHASRDVQALFGSRWFQVMAPLLVMAVTLSYAHAVLSDRYYVARDLPVVTGVGINLDLVPEGAVQWLATHETPGTLFNNYNSGSYLLYRLAPRVKIYIDPRFDVSAANREIDDALPDPVAFTALLDREGVGTIVLQHPSPESITLLPRLASDPRWRLAFRDANSTIHVRADAPAPPPREPPIALAAPIEPGAARINAFFARFKRACLPAAELTDAFVSAMLGDHGREIDAYRRALARDPGNPKALAFLAAEPATPR